MKVIRPGRWVEEALQLSMTSEEYRDWVLKKLIPEQAGGVHLLRIVGKNSTMHYCLVEGERVIVYELTEEATRLEQMEVMPVA